MGTVDFSGVTGGLAHLFVRARDNANQVTQVIFSLYFEGTGRLTAVAQLPGVIHDANAAKLLFLQSPAAGGRLGIYDRASGTIEDIPLPAGRTVSAPDARLTPAGAVFRTERQQVPTTAFHLWRLGALTTIPGNAGLSASPSGNFALTGDYPNLYLTDTGTGVSTLVSSNAGNIGNDVLDDGTVFFATSDHQIVRYSTGQETILTNDADHLHAWPLADDTGVVFLRRRPNPLPLQSPLDSIGLIEGGQEIVLAGERAATVVPGRDYQRNAGWTAYTDLGAQGQKHVFTRSSQNEIERLTDFAASSDIERLGTNGEVMIRRAGGLYLGDGSRLLPVSSAGESFQIAGDWYVAIGSTFLAVDSD
jgi:hypothetical protein